MRFAALVLFSLVLWAEYVLCATKYTEEDTVIMVSSVQPCHLIGEPDLYGFGMRLGFYISFFTCLIGISLGLYEELNAPRFGFNVLFGALIVILVRNMGQGSFALFEWHIVTSLALVSGAGSLPRPYGWWNDYIVDGKKKSQAARNPPLTMSGGGGEPTAQNTTSPDDGATGADTPEGSVATEEVMSTHAHNVHKREREERAQALAKERNRYFLSGPLSLGTFYFLFSIFLLIQPALYFTKADSGHNEGCPATIFFFGAFDLYNVHWQRWLKAGAILSVFASLGFLLLGMRIILSGALSYSVRQRAITILNQKADDKVARIEKDAADLRALDAKEQQQKKLKIQPTSASTEDLAEELSKDLAKGVEEMSTLQAKRKEIQKKLDKEKEKRLNRWRYQIFSALAFAIIGAVLIYFVERTLQLNDIELAGGLYSVTPSGQLLSLLVAVSTSVAFIVQAVLNKKDVRDRRRELKSARQTLLDEVEARMASLASAAWEGLVEYYNQLVLPFRSLNIWLNSVVDTLLSPGRRHDQGQDGTNNV